MNKIERICFRKLFKDKYEKLWGAFVDARLEMCSARTILKYGSRSSMDGNTISISKGEYMAIMDSLDKAYKSEKELENLLIDIKRDL